MHHTIPKIREYNSEALAKLTSKMSHLSAICGIKEPLSTDMSICIVKFLKENYKDFSYQEIEKAFTEYIKFNLENVKENYGVFSPRFVANVLIEYRKLRNKQISLYHRALDEQKRKQVKEATPEEIEQIEKDYLKVVLFDKYEYAMKENLSFELDYYNANICFWKFWDKGLIEISKDENERFKSKAEKELTAEQKELSEEKKQKLIREISVYLFFNEYLKVKKAKKIDLREMYYF